MISIYIITSYLLDYLNWVPIVFHTSFSSNIIPGFSDYVIEFHTLVRNAYSVWRAAGKPRGSYMI